MKTYHPVDIFTFESWAENLDGEEIDVVVHVFWYEHKEPDANEIWSDWDNYGYTDVDFYVTTNHGCQFTPSDEDSDRIYDEACDEVVNHITSVEYGRDYEE